ncbi:cation transporter [Candidatus Bathyarchaeota archaeon]|nr:cation transporter [Candidatus Bathyarchaeota archaeon]
MRKHKRLNFSRFILTALLEEGPLNLKELEERAFIFVYHFHGFGYSLHAAVQKKLISFLSWLGYRPREDYSAKMKKRREKHEQQINVQLKCKRLIEKGLVRLNEEERYELTENGIVEAEKSAREMKKALTSIRSQYLSPTAAARNTVIADFFLALMKLLAGFFSNSVGLIADGADAAIDTVSASVVWAGIKFKKELAGTLIIILMMFITASSVGYESITTIIETLTATTKPVLMPHLVIMVEGIALIAAVILHFYQRYVGKNNGSLALISQSIDSKNHIYVAGAVIIGAIFSMFGIYFVDALIGAFVASRILIDGFSLSKEVLSSVKGEEIDFSKYKMPLEKHRHLSRLEAFRAWVLYSMKEDNLTTKEELIKSLKRSFKPKYTYILSEFRFRPAIDINFEKEFDGIIKYLLEEKFITKNGENFTLTEDGRKRVDRTFKKIRYLQSE